MTEPTTAAVTVAATELPPLPALPKPDGTLYNRDRTVRGHPFLPPKVRQFALDYGQMCMTLERATAAKRIAGLRAGNTALLEALMDMVWQFIAGDDRDEWFPHRFMAAEEQALAVLVDAGFAEVHPTDPVLHRLKWAALDARKAEPAPAAPPSEGPAA